jgi:hypothetical protein
MTGIYYTGGSLIEVWNVKIATRRSVQCPVDRVTKILNRTGSPVIRFMLWQSFGKVMLVSHKQRSYAWKLTDSGVKSGYLIGWHAHFHGYGHLRRICGEAWRIFRFRGSVWAFWLNHLKKFCTVIGLYFDGFAAWGIRQHGISVYLWVFTISNVYLRDCTILTSDFYQRYLETFSTMFSLRLRQTIWNLYNVCIRSLKRISIPHGQILLTSYWAPSTTQAEASLEILAQRATARERQSLHCNKVDKCMVLQWCIFSLY